MNQNQRLMLAVAISILIISYWQEYVVRPSVVSTPITTEVSLPVVHESSKATAHQLPQKRISFNNDAVSGSINLRGAKLDDLMLKDYRQNLDASSPHVALLRQANGQSYFVHIGWVSKDNIQLPNAHTLWQQDGCDPICLVWRNDEGVLFKIRITLDKLYMFNIEQTVVASNGRAIAGVNPYISINRSTDDEKKESMVHQGLVGFIDGKLQEITFDNLADKKQHSFSSGINWVGFSDKYWLTTLLPDGGNAGKVTINSYNHQGQPKLQLDLLYSTQHIAAGASATVTSNLFAGAKNLDILEAYQAQYNLPLFDRTVDFGILYFITKPIFMLLHMFHDYIGNFGMAIMLLTVFIKLLLFPIAYKGYVGMNNIRRIHPEVMAIRQRYADDHLAMQQELMALYKKEKVNPASGCLPIILQMPVFFALYKVLSVTIEMRQAPFFGWIHDLSAPDPTSLFNLFGLLPWQPPAFLMIGILPILMAATMYWQQRLNPEPPDPTQARFMKMLPVIFLFMCASFPSGMVIYWTWSNLLSILQQSVIQRLSN